MANQRAKNKKSITIWLTEDEKHLMQKAAEACGVTLTDFIRMSYTAPDKLKALKQERQENESP